MEVLFNFNKQWDKVLFEEAVFFNYCDVYGAITID